MTPILLALATATPLALTLAALTTTAAVLTTALVARTLAGRAAGWLRGWLGL